MSVRGKPAGAAAVFELRSASMTLVVLVLKTTDMAAIEQALVERFAETPGMFDHDPVVIDVAQAEGDAQAIDWQMLAALMWRFDMVAIAVRGGTPQQMAAAFAAGLGQAPEALPPASRQPAAAVSPTAAMAPTPALVDEPAVPAEPATALAVSAPQAVPPSVNGAVAPPATDVAVTTSTATEPAPVEPAATPPHVATLIVDKPLRSGQQVYARNGDLVVLAVVNVGAEVIADGSIHVYAPLRGKAIAGAKGDATARIFSTCMEPQLIAIAGTYRTTDSPLPANVLARPAQIRLDGERLVFEPLG